MSLYNENDTSEVPAVLRRLVEKLQLMGIDELTQESLALHEMVSATGGDPGASIEKMSMLLKKIKDFVQTENPNMDAPAREKNIPASCSGQASTEKNHKTPVIPDDFRCPISLELMKDPVIVSTGQVCFMHSHCHDKIQFLHSFPILVAASLTDGIRCFSTQPNMITKY